MWNPAGFSAADNFDGWKQCVDGERRPFGVAVEIQWVWQRIYNDLLKFWRAVRGRQAAVGIEVLKGPASYDYIVNHVFGLYREIFREVPVVFCALNAPDIGEAFPRPKPVHHAVDR